MALTPEQSKVFDAYDQLLASEGWRMFEDDMRKNQESLAPLLLQKDSGMEVLWFCKGRNDVYEHILGLRSMLEQLRAQLEASDE